MTVDEIVSMLRHARVALGLTQAEVARRMDKRQTDVSDLENANRRPLLSTVCDWAEALGLVITVDMAPGGLKTRRIDIGDD